MTNLRSIFHRRLRLTVAGLWIVGIGLAGFTAPLAWRRTGVVSALPFIAVVVTGVRLTAGVFRMERWALAVSIFLLGAQLAGAVASAWQLMAGVQDTKAGELRRLGVDPELGVALNLAYSTVAFAVFCWAAMRWWTARRDQP